jgi:L-cysteine:1D-myo-inositol 2-amino-2-deoxy-alpha-D-glucopyranoside ligase
VQVQAHTGLIGLEGRKMSKSLGNLVLVSQLLEQGVEPAAIRLALIQDHYRRDRDWSAELLARAQRRLSEWRSALTGVGKAGDPDGGPQLGDDAGGSTRSGADPAQAETLARVRRALALDLDTPAAIAAVDHYVANRRPTDPAPILVRNTLHALLGVDLEPPD